MTTPRSTRLLLTPQIAAIIMGHLHNPADLKNVSLVCRTLHAAVRPHLFRCLIFPRFEASTPDPSKPLAYPLSPDYTHEKNSGIDCNFTSHARSLKIPRDIAASHVVVGNAPGAHELARYKLESLPVYRAIRWYLKRTPHLEHFESHGVPRLLHLFLLLWDCVPKIRSIKMEARGDVREEQFLDSTGKTLAQDRPEFLETPDWSTFGTRTYIVPESRLSFPHLTILALHGLPFDEARRYYLVIRTPSTRLRELVLLLKGAPHLSCLELSASVPGTKMPRGAMIQELCRDYGQAGGKILEKLRYIKLGIGFELYFPQNADPGYYYVEPAQFLSSLLDFSRIEELHLQYADYVDGPYFPAKLYLSPHKGHVFRLAFNTHLARKLINPLRLPRLRKLTLPWAESCTWKMISDSFSDSTLKQNLVIHFFDECHLQSRELLPRSESYSYLWHFHDRHWSYPLSGLVLPTNSMFPPEQEFFSPLRMTTLTSLKTTLPSLCTFGTFRSTFYDKAPAICRSRISNIDIISWRFRRIRNLRELWLAGDSRHEPHKRTIEHIQSHHNLQIEHLAMAFIQRFRKLEYIRILDRAWRIARRDDADDNDNEEEGGCSGDDDVEGEERTEAVARELSPWEVENDIPESFDYRTPSLFRGRQYS